MAGRSRVERKLIGREPERAVLAGLLDRVHDRGGALVVRGEPGIGKSALLAELAHRAAGSGLRVLTALGAESEEHLPYAGLHQLVHPIRAGLDALPAGQRDALGAAIGLTDTTVPDRHLVGLAVLNLLAESAADRPVLLVAEDAQWLDRPSTDALAFLARRLESEPIVLVAAVRDGSRYPLEDAGLPGLTVGHLSEEEAATLLDEVAPGLEPAVRAQVLREAAGNPLALTELPRTAAAADTLSPLPLTTRLERAFSGRVGDLPAGTRTALLIAALNDSSSADEALAATAVRTGAAAGMAVLEPAVDLRLIDVRDGRVTFRHPLIRSAITQAARAGDRLAAHTALADVLTDRPDRRTWHRAHAVAGVDENVATELEHAAHRAQRRGGAAAAVLAWERAARLSATDAGRAERLLRGAELAGDAGRRDVVRRLLDEADTLVLTPLQRARVIWTRAGFDEGMRDDPVEAATLVQLAEALAVGGDTELARRVLWSAAMRCFWTEPGPEARDRILQVAQSLLDAGDARLLAVTAYTVPLAQGDAIVGELRRRAADPGSDPEDGRYLSSAALQVGAFDVAARLVTAPLAALRAQGRLGLVARGLTVQALSTVRLGDLDTAMAAADEAVRLTRETEQPSMYGLARACQAEIAALRGLTDLAEMLAADAERESMAAGVRAVLAVVQRARGIAALAGQRPADAYAHLRRLHDPADPACHPALRWYAIPDLVEAAVRSGRAGDLTGIVAELEEVARRTSSPAVHAGLRYARAVLEPEDRAESRYREALHADLVGWPLERARVELAYGEWLRRRRRIAESRAHLRTAREMFGALGAVPWSERARQELRATGESSPRRDPDARDLLTPHELNIARLAADGLTNREIGQRLYLSHRTVSTHLHRIFPKLGVTSRAELAAVLDRGLVA
ncbi:ATP-binding protein [Jidongwangia harbinensis]|uniref:ATP-binding protein n=1 Tax=Jidongwangia harbinensis TaxID=2878561 RepID=UPI001CD9A71A|nr:LuxR family transcriptional regulator [Jidongwangia harbinensis]MCA2213172.1 AAA family ATPase [Jidongwangia harbinensis]